MLRKKFGADAVPAAVCPDFPVRKVMLTVGRICFRGSALRCTIDVAGRNLNPGSGGTLVRKWLLTFVATAMFACLMLLHFPERMIAAAPAHAAVRITAGPELETANSTLAIVRWTTTNPGGTALHYGIVHYGTDATNLSRVAKSPNRRNPPHPDMIFRVRVAGLQPQTVYYYTVESVGATGMNDGVSSPIKTFKTGS